MRAVASEVGDWTLQQVVVDGGTVRYVDVGRGETVLLLHGYLQSHLAWRRQIATLARHYRVVAPDLPGWGESDRDPALSYAYRDEVQRLRCLVDAIGLDRFNLFAHDYGALLGLGYVDAEPTRVMRLALLNFRAHLDFRPIYQLLIRVHGALARSPRLRPFVAALPWYAIARAIGRPHVRQGCFDRAVLDRYLHWLRAPEGRQWLQIYHAGYRVGRMPELEEVMARVSCPSMVIWATADRYCTTETGRDLARRIPNAQFRPVEGADHFVMEERPDDVLAGLEDLLGVTVPFAASSPPIACASRATPR